MLFGRVWAKKMSPYCILLEHIKTCLKRSFQNRQNKDLKDAINRGSHMSAHILLNLFNELGKRDKMRGLPSILSLFRNEFNKFNKT